ncbi:hypothetical protein ACFVGM_28460 [Kitasatospora purpeofusca]|uniref:hypothetical protein n=1 Tax=Kitasatospora purpeofusca TaxID=67352 RepID=UPI0036BECE00
MHRRVPTKRTFALGAIGLLTGAVAALAAPALADSGPRPRVAPVQALTLDFSGSAAPGADVYGSRGVVKDTTGAAIGDVQELCAKGLTDAAKDTAFCHGTVRIKDQGEIAYSAVLPLTDAVAAPDEHGFTGVAEGGTRDYEGITGEARFQPRGAGVYDLNFG